MTGILSVAIGIGLAVSLLFSEIFGLAAGGMVVPGYFALFLNKPGAVVMTLLASIATYFIVHLLSTFVIVYGKRRTVLMILVGYLVRMVFDAIPLSAFGIATLTNGRADLEIIGFIIPGLIAIWIDRQGLIETISALTVVSVVIRLILILIYGTELP